MYIVLGDQASFISRAQYEARETHQRFRLFEDPRMAEARDGDPVAFAPEDATELNIICHGTPAPTIRLAAEEGEDSGSFRTYTPAEFFAQLKAKISTRQIPSTIKTINFAACNIGLSWSGHPSWIEELQGLIAADEELNNIKVQGIPYHTTAPEEVASLFAYIPRAESGTRVTYRAALQSISQRASLDHLKAEKAMLTDQRVKREVLTGIIPYQRAKLAEAHAEHDVLDAERINLLRQIAQANAMLAGSLASPVLADETAELNRKMREVELRFAIKNLNEKVESTLLSLAGNGTDIAYYTERLAQSEAELATLPSEATVVAALEANSARQQSMVDSFTVVVSSSEGSPFLAEFCARSMAKEHSRLAGGVGLSTGAAGGAGGDTVTASTCASLSLPAAHFDTSQFSRRSSSDNSNTDDDNDSSQDSLRG